MKTELLHIDNIPDEKELFFLLGETLCMYYRTLCKTIVSLLAPDLEIWDHAGRRGKYLHGYRINEQSIFVYLYLSSVNGEGQLKCEFKFNEMSFAKVVSQKSAFSEKTQESINFSIEYNKKYSGFYLNLIINEETFPDVIYLIKII